jgi:hypothetical protein
MLTAFAGVKYGCCRMLDGLVSTHPTSGAYGTLASPRVSNTLALYHKGSNFYACRISVTRISALKRLAVEVNTKKIVQYKLKHLFGAEICVTEIQQASKL